MGGATIIPRSLKTTRNEKIFQDRQKKILFFKSYMTLRHLLIIDFPKFDLLTAAVYHRERILETSTLSCNEEEEEITKPPTK